MKGFKLFFLVGILFFIWSCSKPTEENVFYEAQKYFNKIETYRCIVDVTVKGNKDTESYKAKHVFKKPNKYIIEILEPLENKGNITLYDGKQAWLYNKQVDESFIIKDLEQSLDKSLFVGYFLRSVMTNENIVMYFEEIEDKKYLVLEVDIPGNNKHRSIERLWIDSSNYHPYKLVIYKENGEIFTEVDYSEFKANIKINDEDFNIKTGLDYIRKL
ncbi:Outer membrane lipoprotein-sorting protein [Proteiniborus ethanoligenes]|uniref:Outer membrane lipoprotein-sorting protein n=2 Tax=Proteiniborus ethanoligenes TaxID=415015 RepID=A0A1H3SF52_9FIRM|nr:Outer membrane lipoprotein-sorting protein [Proteiniborus ethanoligenes]